MKYIVRALKYFVYICVIMTLILGALILLKVVDADVSKLFRNGYDSLWQIALMFFAVSMFYPKFGYCRRSVIVPGEYSEVRGGLMDCMKDLGYELENENGENPAFRLCSTFGRITRTWEDRVTFTRELPGFYVEGRAKDVARIISALEYKFRERED